MNYSVQPIGILHTPYTFEKQNAPFQSIEEDQGEFFVEVYPEHSKRLDCLDSFNYMIILYWLDKSKRSPNQLVTPPWTSKTVGLFASRSPNRINPIGLSVVQIKHITKNRIVTSGIDAFDGTPLIDIKPYIRSIDLKEKANNGWIDTD